MTIGEEAVLFNRMCKSIKLSVEIFAAQTGISRNQAMGMMFSAFILDIVGVQVDRENFVVALREQLEHLETYTAVCARENDFFAVNHTLYPPYLSFILRFYVIRKKF